MVNELRRRYISMDKKLHVALKAGDEAKAGECMKAMIEILQISIDYQKKVNRWLNRGLVVIITNIGVMFAGVGLHNHNLISDGQHQLIGHVTFLVTIVYLLFLTVILWYWKEKCIHV